MKEYRILHSGKPWYVTTCKRCFKRNIDAVVALANDEWLDISTVAIEIADVQSLLRFVTGKPCHA